MQRRTLLILKRCALFAFVLAASQGIVFLYVQIASFESIGDIDTSQWLEITGKFLVAFASMFVIIFPVAAGVVLLFLGIAQYVYDRFYRSPTL